MSPPLAIIELDNFGEETVLLDGGRLYLYSDGVTEARLDDGSMLEEPGFYDLVKNQPNADTRSRLAGLVTALRALEIGDDTTLMMLEGR